MSPCGVKIEMRQGAKGLHVQLLPPFQTIEPAGHEMPAAVFFQEATGAHLDARFPGHQGVRVLDNAIPLRIFKLFVRRQFRIRR